MKGRLPCCFDFRQSGRGWQLVCGTGHRDRRGYGSFLTARSENGSSMPLNLYVTSPITGDMMQECGDILQELTGYLSQQGYQEEERYFCLQ